MKTDYGKWLCFYAIGKDLCARECRQLAKLIFWTQVIAVASPTFMEIAITTCDFLLLEHFVRSLMLFIIFLTQPGNKCLIAREINC